MAHPLFILAVLALNVAIILASRFIGRYLCGFVCPYGALARRMDKFSDNVFGLRLHPRALGFWGWLGGQLVRSNIEVARIILTPRLSISPTLVEIDALPKGRLGQAILGNSITLTPGSLTIDDHEGKLLVHCLTESGARELESGEMNRRAAALTDD